MIIHLWEYTCFKTHFNIQPWSYNSERDLVTYGTDLAILAQDSEGFSQFLTVLAS